MSKQLRILYAAGPGNIIGTYEFWTQGMDDPSQMAIAYSRQFYDLCMELGAIGYAISSHGDLQKRHVGDLILEHRPKGRYRTGLGYHLNQISYGFGLVLSAVRFRADVVLISGDSTHFFVLSLLPRLGIRVIPTLHCVLWHKYLPPSRGQQFFLRLGAAFFARDCHSILSVSNDIAEQIRQLTQQQNKPIALFRPTYRRSEFESVSPPDPARSPFQILFAGRIERDKGVFDLLDVARQFKQMARDDIIFNLCGAGSALEEVQSEVARLELAELFFCRGYCQKLQMRTYMSQSHVVVVPTRTNFVEGFNKVVAEAILTGRPVIASAVCPALDYVREAAVEVPPNDVEAYRDAILQLASDRALYREKCQQAARLQEQFYDCSQSWGEQLKSTLATLK